MKVSPSLYSSKESLLDTIRLVRNSFADYIHIDCNKKLEEIHSDISVIRKNCDLLIDMHIMDPDPEQHIDLIKKIKPEYLAIQFENLNNSSSFVNILGQLPNVGLAITQETKFKDVDELIKKSDYVLLMTTVPGVSGVKFTEHSMNWIKEFKKLYPNKRVHIDGGVNDKIAIELKLLGVDCVVSGSYLMNSSSMIASVLIMKGINKNAKASDFMISLDYLPVIDSSKNLIKILQAIETGQRGFTFVIDQEAWGIVTDGDVRRHLIENSGKEQPVNIHPFTVKHNDTIQMIIKKMLNLKIKKKLKFIIVTEYNKPVGIIHLNSIIKG